MPFIKTEDCKGMEPQVSNGIVSFLWNQMGDQINRNGSKEFKTRDEIREHIKDTQDCRVIGHIIIFCNFVGTI